MTPSDVPTHLPHFIDGAAADSTSGAVFDVLDPVSNKPYATASAGDFASAHERLARGRPSKNGTAE